MTKRTTIKTVTFTRPFTLRGMDEERPAGAYVVETDEELVEPLSFAAYRRTATWIRLPRRPGGNDSEQLARIDPDELDEAMGPATTTERPGSKTMTMKPPASAVPLSAPWTTMVGYFVPPLVVPVVLLLAVLLFALIHGPVT